MKWYKITSLRDTFVILNSLQTIPIHLLFLCVKSWIFLLFQASKNNPNGTMWVGKITYFWLVKTHVTPVMKSHTCRHDFVLKENKPKMVVNQWFRTVVFNLFCLWPHKTRQCQFMTPHHRLLEILDFKRPERVKKQKNRENFRKNKYNFYVTEIICIFFNPIIILWPFRFILWLHADPGVGM